MNYYINYQLALAHQDELRRQASRRRPRQYVASRQSLRTPNVWLRRAARAGRGLLGAQPIRGCEAARDGVAGAPLVGGCAPSRS